MFGGGIDYNHPLLMNNVHFDLTTENSEPVGAGLDMTGNDRWVTVMEDSLRSVNQTEPGIFDVHSASDKKSLEGTPYSDW